ncbi:AI-2E family transporter [Clostridium ihumii]|uniref:AI-2E family transporter n=1 Tax=Clostridium ihumii TaxID=1470356 RepID=UPI00058EB7D6|nr:AI-2E family transporter [Clostridium ihumii]
MIERLKKDNRYIKYGMIIFIAIVVVVTVKAIAYGDDILAWLFFQLRRFIKVISPIIYAIIISYLLYKPIKWIEGLIYRGLNYVLKKNDADKYSKTVRVISIFILFFMIILGLIIIYKFLVPPLMENFNDIIDALPMFQAKLKQWAINIAEKFDIKSIHFENTNKISIDIMNKLKNVLEGLLAKIIITLSNISSFLLNFIMTMILTAYFLIDKERIVKQVKEIIDVLLPKKASRALKTFFYDVDYVVGGYIVGELLDCIIVGIASTILLMIVKHPYAVIIGVIAGVTNIIPYVGPIIGAVLAFFFGMFTSLSLAITGTILLLIYQQVDGNFIQPKIVGDKIGLSAVWVFIAVLIGGSYFGALGMVISIPVAGLVRVYFNRYKEYKKLKNDI